MRPLVRTRTLALALAAGLSCGEDDGEADDAGATETSTSPSTSAAATSPSSTATDTGPVTTTETGSDTGSDTTDASTDASTTADESSSSTGATACALNNEWIVVDDYTPAASIDAQARGAVADGEGRVYVLGVSDDLWTIRRSDNGTDEWETVDAFELEPGLGALAAAGAVAADGTIYAVGSARANDLIARRVVRRSDDGGESWETVDTFQLEPGFDTYAAAIAVAPDGTVYASGQAGSATSSHWTIRASSDGGASWTTDSDYQLAPGHLCLPQDLSVDEDGLAYAVGVCEDAAASRHWIVRRRDAGSWSTIDDLAAVGGGAFAAGSVTTLDGRVLVTGAETVGGVQHWLVRASVDDGRWSEIDRVSELAATLGAGSIHDDGDGTLIAAGSRNDGEPQVLTRRSDDDGATWETIDEFGYEAGIYGGGLANDPDGNLYTVGIGLTAGGIEHWIVRRMACEG